MASSHTPYHALDSDNEQMGLLNLLPGADADVLTGDLLNVNLFEKGILRSDLAYEAVSYCWGDKALRGTININGASMEIPRSASQALRRLRYRDKPRVLWLDSACINQTDNAEKSCQVALMHLLYGLARKCLIWLGEEDGTEAAAIDTIALLEAEMDEATADGVKIFDVLYTVHRNRRRHPAKSFERGNIKAVLSLLARPWFKRVWTIQEAALASSTTCFCGRFEIDLVRVFRVTTWLMYKRNALLSLGV